MAWRLARSLETLRSEILSLHPGTTFWTIGDPAHADTWSDHNPNAAGVVCAADVLGDKGLNLGQFAETVRTSNHSAFKYVIFNRRIASKGGSWQPYYGDNPHTTHVHVSVGTGPDGRSTGPYDNTTPWGIGKGADMPITKADATLIADTLLETSWAKPSGATYSRPKTWIVKTRLDSAVNNSIKGWRKADELLAGQAAILAAVKGDDAPAIQAMVRAELDRAAAAETKLRAAEREALVGPMAAAVAAAVDHTLDTKAVEQALRNVLGSLDGV